VLRPEFLGVGAAPVVLEAAGEAVGVTLQRTGLGADPALTLLALAFPMDASGFFGHRVAPVSVGLKCDEFSRRQFGDGIEFIRQRPV